MHEWGRIIFDDWSEVRRIAIIAPLAYLVLLTVLRVTGKRTLAKLNAFDFVITIALGSALSAIILDDSISLVEGSFALIMLVGLQFLVSFTSTRSKTFRQITRSEPTLLLWLGSPLDDALRSERLAQEELCQAVRSQGHASLDDLQAVVLETDGTLSVVTSTKKSNNALKGTGPGLE